MKRQVFLLATVIAVSFLFILGTKHMYSLYVFKYTMVHYCNRMVRHERLLTQQIVRRYDSSKSQKALLRQLNIARDRLQKAREDLDTYVVFTIDKRRVVRLLLNAARIHSVVAKQLSNQIVPRPPNLQT